MFSRRLDNILGPASHVLGTVTFDGLLLLEGTLKGALVGRGNRAKAIIKGCMEGPVQADTVFVEGTILGDVTAQAVVIHPRGVVLGRVTTEVLHLEKGGRIEGPLVVPPPRAVAEPAAALSGKKTSSAEAAKARLLEQTSRRPAAGA